MLDNLDLFDRFDAKQAAELAKLPTCDYCGEKIQSEDCYNVGGDLICPDCMDFYFKEQTEKYKRVKHGA